MNSISRILQCYSYIFHWKDKTFKLFTPLGGATKNAELRGNKKALQTNFWADKVIEVSSYPMSLAMVKGIPLSQSKSNRAEEFIASKLEEALSCERKPASTTYNFQKLQKLSQHGVDKRLLEKAHDMLRSLMLPITSAHGDLHIENMILVEDELKIIDWTMYNRQGSFITDYIHFFNFYAAVRDNESWTVAILKDREYLQALAQQLSTETILLKLAYTINRISGEIDQFRNMHLIPAWQIDKYNAVLNHLTLANKPNV